MLGRPPASELTRRTAPVAAVVIVWALTMALGRFELPSAILALAIAAVPLAIVSFTMTGPTAERWARARGAVVDGPELDVLAHQLWRARVARTVGVAGAMGAEMMMMSHHNADPAAFRWYVDVWNRDLRGIWMIGLGYVVASLWAELTKPGPAPDSPRVAVLATRRVADFLDRGVEAALLIGLAAVPLGWVVQVIRPSATGGDPLVPVVLGLGVAAAALVGVRVAVRRAEPTDSPTALATEELTRTASVNALTGCAAAMALSAGAELVAHGAPGWWSLVGAAMGLAAVGIWPASGTNLVFRTRRIERLRADPA